MRVRLPTTASASIQARERREKRHADAVAFHTWQLELKAERERKFTEFLYSAQLLGDLSREELDARFRKLHPEWGRPLPPAPRALPASSQWVGEEPPRDYEPATPDLGPPPRPPRPPDTPSFKDDSALICVADSSWYGPYGFDYSPSKGHLILPYLRHWVVDANGLYIPCKGYRLDVAHDYVTGQGDLARQKRRPEWHPCEARNEARALAARGHESLRPARRQKPAFSLVASHCASFAALCSSVERPPVQRRPA